MAQRLSNSFINTSVPGAYPNVSVISTAAGVGASGIIAIIGEADGGNSYQNVALANNFFTPDQYDQVIQAYTSGPVVDAFNAFTAPSNDTDITGTANTIYIIKTNSGSKASALVDTNYGTLQAINWGTSGNNNKYQITSTAAEIAPTVTSSVITAFGAALNSASFSISLNGGAPTVVTLSATSSNHATAAELATELNTMLPSGITAAAGTVINTIVLTVAADATANRSGSGKSFELVDSTPGDLTALGLTAGIITSAQEPAIEVNIVNSATSTNETIDVSAVVGLTVGYAGTSGTLTINSAKTLLTTTVVGGAGTSLSINMAQFTTVADLASFIASQAGYSATVVAAARQLPPSALDSVSAIGISSAINQPGRIKFANSAFIKAIGTSTAVSFVSTATAGLPSIMTSSAYLAGGARGATSASDIVNALDQLGGIQVNIIVPLFSQDATADIALGLTDSTSTYTIAAIQAATKNHCIEYSTPKLKRNRIAILSNLDTFVNDKSIAQGLAQARCSLAIQPSTQVNSLGVLTVFQPWYTACIAAGMQAGGFYKAIVNKYANVVSFTDPVGFDSGSPGDVEDALDAGLLILTQDTGGNRWVSDQTTYGYDTNFVYNSIQAMYCSDLIALDLAQSFQQTFVGKSLADVDASVCLAYLSQKMTQYRQQKLIAPSDDAPLGYKKAKIQITAPTVNVSVEIKLATAIYFIPINLYISAVESTAS